MENLTSNITEILILLFLIITFLQSGLDKITDWKGNLEWLKGHFSKTFIRNMVPLALVKLLIFELISAGLCIAGIYQLLANNSNTFGLWGCVVSCLTLLGLLMGQRVAKDYDGARTIVIYFMPAIFGVFLMSV